MEMFHFARGHTGGGLPRRTLIVVISVIDTIIRLLLLSPYYYCYSYQYHYHFYATKASPHICLAQHKYVRRIRNLKSELALCRPFCRVFAPTQ